MLAFIAVSIMRVPFLLQRALMWKNVEALHPDLDARHVCNSGQCWTQKMGMQLQVSWTHPGTFQRLQHPAALLRLFCSSTAFDVALLELGPGLGQMSQSTCNLAASGALNAEPYPTQLLECKEHPSSAFRSSGTAQMQSACKAAKSPGPRFAGGCLHACMQDWFQDCML
jgi:hypothetical protein